ncbi:helix-turn-helix transcriptional regulator [Sulfurospirillum deleyianum]|uniref:Prophage CP4-57 regulatory n=1 Tax=Sulfurospirillum deleyianum (strain ATCC 51133 / DSM 6946 / 5175) TaxID=525898 RepID=D1AZM3_SULD5|nr:helix-turn-helix domain-containing protein [Sulfurospirillum deleyianum]ACZ11490.1 Prophage CP4-57 regulatory [Sulfurospirillum deleyianum DSM 6946]
MTQTQNENMRIKQVAETYPVSRASIWRYVKDGKIKAYKITDGVTIFKRSELESFFNGES